MAKLVLLLIEAAALVVLRLLINAIRPGLLSIPGPWLAKFTDLYKGLLNYNGRFSLDILDLHRKYGNYVRIGPNTVSIADRHVIEHIYGSKTNFPKSDWVKSSQTLYQGKVVPALMTTQDKAYHHAMKKAIGGAYSVTTLKGYEDGVEDTVRLFIQRMEEEFIDTGKSCTMHDWLQWYAYDVIGVITMSQRLGFLAQGTDVDNMLGEIKEEGHYRAFTAQMPWVDWAIRKNPLVTLFARPTHKIMVRAKKMLDDRLADPEHHTQGRRDFISRFLEAKEKNPQTLSDRNMLGFVGSNLQAGSDTTAIALRTILYHVARDNRVRDKLRKEIDESTMHHPISHQHAFHSMPYVDAVIRESLRLHPPFAMLLERMVPEGGLELPNGKVIPAGTKVGTFGYTIHRDPEIYGEDVDSFNPDRWLQRDDESDDDFSERFSAMKSYDLSFGIGSRACAGRHVAELQLYKFVPAVFGLLDFELVDPNKEWKLEQKFFSLQQDMDMNVKWRPGMSLQTMDAMV